MPSENDYLARSMDLGTALNTGRGAGAVRALLAQIASNKHPPFWRRCTPPCCPPRARVSSPPSPTSALSDRA